MSKGFIHPTAVIGGPPEHRKYIWRFYAGHWDTYAEPFFLPEISDQAIIHAFCTIDAGTFRRTHIGRGCFLMARVHVGHDVWIGDGCEIGAGVAIGGEVMIGNNVQIGGNSWIKPQVTIGDAARIGGGSVVVKNVPAGEVWAGNPAAPLRSGREAEARGQVDMMAKALEYDDHQHLKVVE